MSLKDKELVNTFSFLQMLRLFTWRGTKLLFPLYLITTILIKKRDMR